MPILRSPLQAVTLTDSNHSAPALNCNSYGVQGRGEGGLVPAAPAKSASLPCQAPAPAILAPDIDLTGLPIIRTASPRLRAGFLQRMLFVLGLLLHRAILFGGDNYHPLHFRTLALLVGPRHVKKLLRALVGARVIQTDHTYIVGKKSRGYRLNRWVLQQPLTEITLCNDLTLAVKRYTRRMGPREACEKPAHRIIFENLQRLSVTPAAWPLLAASESTKTATRAQWAYTLRVIESRAFSQSVSAVTGRVFNVVTGTASVLRAYLRLDGCPVVEVDVRACQPFLLATLYPKGSLERAKYLTAVTTGDFYELFLSTLARN